MTQVMKQVSQKYLQLHIYPAQFGETDMLLHWFNCPKLHKGSKEGGNQIAAKISGCFSSLGLPGFDIRRGDG